MKSSHSQTPDIDDVLQAAWALVLPRPRHVRVVGRIPSALQRWWERHDVTVSQEIRSQQASVPAAACGSADHLLLVWPQAEADASSLPEDVRAQEVIVWSPATSPWDALRRLWGRTHLHPDLQLHERLFAWPQIPHPRQIIPQSRWRHTSLVAHRRSQRAWKKLLRQSSLGPLMAPGWLTRWVPVGGVAHASWLDDILTQASHDTGRELVMQDLRLSPNGVAIVRAHGRRDGDAVGILKIPLADTAAPRVANNARALHWMRHGGAPGAWAEAPPRLLASAATHGCPWTLEECVAGSEAQTWSLAAARDAVRHIATLLRAFQDRGRPCQASVHPCMQRSVEQVAAVARLLPADLAQRLQEVWRQTVRTLEDVSIPSVPQHGDCKLENVLGDPQRIQHLRLLDWELWKQDGLPLLDLLHLLLSRRRRDQGVSIGGSICRWLLVGELDDWEKRLLDEQAHGLDRLYVAALPLLYWLERIGPVAERGRWPTQAWARSNVYQVIEQLTPNAVEVVA